jgi:hypothetical protein
MFVKEGVLDVRIPPQRKFVSRCLILFTDTLLCTVKKGSMIKFQCFFKLASLDAKEVSGTPIGNPSGFVFALFDPSSSGETSGTVIYLQASSADERKEWLDQLKEQCSRAKAQMKRGTMVLE